MQKPPTVKSFCLIWTFLSFPESSNLYLWLKVLSCDFTTRARPPLLMNLDDVVKRGVFWSRTQSLSYFVDRVPLSLAPNDCRKRPRDLKARSRRQSLQKQIKLWNVESDWKLCSIKKKRKNRWLPESYVLIKRLLIYWLHLARADKDRVLFLKSIHKAAILLGASVLHISNNLRILVPLILTSRWWICWANWVF